MSRSVSSTVNKPEQYFKPRVTPTERRVQRRREARAWRTEQFS